MADSVYLNVKEGYDLWSTIYDEEDNPLVALEEPVVRLWSQGVRGQRIADIGCGTGRHSIRLAQEGACIDAYDLSLGMMAKAMQKLQGTNTSFLQHAFPNPLPANDNTYDMVVFALVADHIENLPAAFREINRVLKPAGKAIFTVLHPAMNLRGVTARFTNPTTEDQVKVAAYEHTYGDFVTAVLEANLRIEIIVEKRGSEELAKRAPRAEKYIDWPMLLAMLLQKPMAS